jgi:glycosyltransferase involved in cell wall biosynthesis
MRSAGDGVWIVTPLTLPFPSSALARSTNAWIQARTLAKAMRSLRFRKPIVWVAGPIFEPLLERLAGRIVLYDCFDEWTAFPGVDGALLGRLEVETIRRSDLVIAASERLVEAKRHIGAEIHVLRNGVHVERFAEPLAPEPADLASIPRPRLGYVGNIYGRLDVETLARVADARPDWSIVLVGLVRTPIGDLTQRPNVHVLGHRPKEQVPTYLRHLDLGLVPHRPGPLTDRQDPTKIYEYWAAGLPVVATELEALDAFGAEVRRVPAGGDWVAAIADELARECESRREARSREAARHSWTSRARELSGLLSDALARRDARVP